MQHLYKDLGVLKSGTPVTVQLRNQANVRLMTAGEYRKFKSGGQYQFIGGRAIRSPVVVTIPNQGEWVIVIDLGGYVGKISASVTVG